MAPMPNRKLRRRQTRFTLQTLSVDNCCGTGNDVFCLVKRFEFLFWQRWPYLRLILFIIMFQFMFQFKFVSKMRANVWISEAMFVPAVVIDLVSFITTYLSVPTCSTFAICHCQWYQVTLDSSKKRSRFFRIDSPTYMPRSGVTMRRKHIYPHFQW